MPKSPQRPPLRRLLLPIQRISQPDEVSCGPTCVAQVLRLFGETRPLSDLLNQVRRNADGGTQAVWLGQLALDLGYRARLYPFGVRVFDPTWWRLEPAELISRLEARSAALSRQPGRERDVITTDAWRDFVSAGGKVAFVEPSPKLLVRILDRGRPIICGLSASWLYRESRERPDDNVSDDILGEPVGHFVVVRGYTGGGLHLHIVDPADDPPPSLPSPKAAPPSAHGEYPLPASRLLHAVLLGDTTRDAVLLEIWPARPRS